MSGASLFERELDFSAADDPALQSLPAAAGVLALYGAFGDRPYLSKTTNLQRRAARLLQATEDQAARVSMRDRVSRVAWRTTGSDFESNLVLYRAYAEAFSLDEARKRLRLRTPFFVRFSAENRFPRVYVSNRMSRRGLPQTYGPFASRAAAERYVDGVNDLFRMRRCYEELHPSPGHPGCVYGEMHKCTAPCQQRVSQIEYRADAERVETFLKTGGASLLAEITAVRDKASEEMDFEGAAAAHARYTAVKDAADAAGDLVRPLPDLRAVLFLPSAHDAMDVEVWVLRGGRLHGPERFSTLGVRIAKEQAEVGSSLFAQPLMLQAVPLEGEVIAPIETPEERLLALLTGLEDGSTALSNQDEISDYLALLKRWYYRPETKRVGALCMHEGDAWPVRKLVRSAAKVAMKAGAGAILLAAPAPDADRLDPL